MRRPPKTRLCGDSDIRFRLCVHCNCFIDKWLVTDFSVCGTCKNSSKMCRDAHWQHKAMCGKHVVRTKLVDINAHDCCN